MRPISSFVTAFLFVLASCATSACGGSNGALPDKGDGGSSVMPGPDGGIPGAEAGGTSTCGMAIACGSAGATYEECTELADDGQCSAIVYQVSSGRSFTCSGCTSCDGVQQQLGAYCASSPANDAGAADAGGPDSSTARDGSTPTPDSGTQDGSVPTEAGPGPDGGPEGGMDASPEAGTTTQCQSPQACGSGSITYEQCTTSAATGACLSTAYVLSNGMTYTCSSCSDCSAAVSQLGAYCQSQETPTTTCAAWSACEESSLSDELCTTTAGSTCEGMYYETSDGQQFTCASCSDCTGASSSLDAYCDSKTPPVTTCGAAMACGQGVVTYEQCTTSQGGACQSIDYQTTTGETFTCNTCSDCAAALGGLDAYCASLVGTGGVVLFAGIEDDGVTLAPDTWIWNGAAWMTGPASAPPGRSNTSGASLGSSFVLFGGSDATAATMMGDTWTFNGAAWAESATTGPSARLGAATASIGSSVLLFGGATSDSVTNIVADTWLWNGATWTSLPITGPSGRAGAATATLDGQVVLFGGIDATGAYPTDTWVFDGTAWTALTPATSPPGRSYAAMATLNGQAVLFGGLDGGELGDTWVWDGANWTQMSVTGPTARDAAGMTSWNGSVLLFGGCPATADTWTWNGSAWTQLTATGPEARCGAVLGTF